MSETQQNLSGLIEFGWLRVKNYLKRASELGILSGISAMRLIEQLKMGKEFDALLSDLRDASSVPQTVAHWIESPEPDFVGMAELQARFGLAAADIEILAMLAAMVLDPALRDLCVCAAGMRDMTAGSLCQILANGDLSEFEQYLPQLAYDAPLCRNALVTVSSFSDASGVRSLSEREVRIADRVIDFLRCPQELGDRLDEALANHAVRRCEAVDLSSLYLPQHCQTAIVQMIRAQSLPALLTGPADTDKARVAGAIATMMNRHVICVDLASLLDLSPETMKMRLCALFRDARMGNDLVYLDCVQLPEQISGAHKIVLRGSLSKETWIAGVEIMPMWLVDLTKGMMQIGIPLPGLEHRIALWTEVLGGDKRSPKTETIEAIARRYEMSEPQIRQAAAEAKRQSMLLRRKRIDITDLDKACRGYFSLKLSDIADLMPPSAFRPEQLILPESEREKFDEVLLYAKSQDTIYSEWGFGEQDAQGRGLSVLFYGPPGTGKSMAASIIASELGLDLFRIDLSRLANSGDAESESSLANIFDEAEHSHAMLLLEEIDALFARRSSDRTGFFDLSHLLQKIENFEGVTVLTTTNESVIDDTFKRHIRYRINFPMPDAQTRELLFKSLIPANAPVRKGIPFGLLGEHFEISGGYIKQTVLKAAFYAKRDNAAIGLSQLTEAAIAECRKLGMLMNDNLPRPLTNALRAEKGLPPLNEEEYRRIHKPVISQDLPLLDLPEGVPIAGREEDDYR